MNTADVAELRVARYRFDLEAVDPLHLPVYKGGTLRGGFGYAFKKMVCAERDWMGCTPCRRGNSCPYGYIFESTLPEGSALFSGLREVPPPFVLEPPLSSQTAYQPGDRLSFDLVLIGRGIEYLPYFLLAFQELGRMGIGKPRGRYVLQRIVQRPLWKGAEVLIYDGVDVRVAVGQDGAAAEIVAHAAQLPGDEVTIEFLTPTRIKYQRGFVAQPDFHVLIRTLLRRVSSLLYFHGGQLWQPPRSELIAAAEQVTTVRQAVRWVEWERFSGRQQQRIELGGFVGAMEYRGDLAPFRSLLALGEIVHVGKATVFGHGRYHVLLDK